MNLQPDNSIYLVFLQCAYEMELDGVDIHFAVFASTESEYLRPVRMSALERGLVISNIGICNDFGNQVAGYGQEKGVVVGLQNHHRITRTGQDVLQILEMVDNPYFGHILDTGLSLGN